MGIILRPSNKNKVPEEGRFQKNLQKSVTRKIVLLLMISAFFFWAGQYIITLMENELNAVSHLEQLEETFFDLDIQNREFLLNDRINDVVRRMYSQTDSSVSDEFKNLFRQFNEDCKVRNEVLIVDKAGNMVFTSFGENRFSSYLLNYNNAICYNARNLNEGEIYRAIYYDRVNYADALFVKPVFEEGSIQGYVTLFLSGSEWNFYLSKSNFDGVITDMRQNVMYISKPGMADNNNKFYGVAHGIWESKGDRYWSVSKELPEYSAVIYSLVHYPKNQTVYIGLLVLFLVGICWYVVAGWMSRTMAENNAASIKNLVKEIRIIRKGDYKHRVQLGTDDEFGEVGNQVNRMLDNIQSLNERNTELLTLNSRIEMEQLTQQMNPHFLYNTLEIIRNLVIFDAPKAEELIVKLTEVLRYSVNTTRKEMTLEEDMQFIDAYLEIQHCRFGDRFHCEIHMEPECSECIVPKMLLQPMIENSIKYGFQKKMELNIQIRGYMDKNMLVIQVLDDGLGMEPQRAKELERQLKEHDNSSSSIGLCNLSRRLYLQYGENSGILIRNREGIGLEVTVQIEQKG
ncbi:sensor histidine kinase [Lacrimispora sp.]|uniref:sensor histidine kinase n=1 Tax=Lacrimispora sp. TaxID=2719234 RepID=UPI002FDB1102